MSSYVYIRHRDGPGGPILFTVGFYAPDGTWEPESDHSDREEAATRVSFLNGNTALTAEVVDALTAWHRANRDGGVSHADFTSIAAKKLTAVCNKLFN